MRIRHSVILLVGILAVSSGRATSETPDEAAIKARVQEWVAAFNRGDAKAAASLYTVDGTHTYFTGVTQRGRAAIEEGLGQLLAGPWKGVRIAITTDAIRFLTPVIALEEESVLISGLKTPAGTELPPLEASCLNVGQKQGDLWFAAAIHCMMPPPTAGSSGK